MLGSLTVNEQYYRRTVTSIGIAMLSLWLLMNGNSVLLPIIQRGIREVVSSEISANVLYQLYYAATYLFIFTIPAMILRKLISRSGYPCLPTQACFRVSRYLPAIVLGGIFLIFVQSCLNEALVSIFNYAAFSEQVLWGDGEIHGYEIILKFIVAALVPAFCEEFLFRGAILTNLLPFGRSNAILISALLFAVMHQNAGQILYAFAAGILLGVVYERTGSIWNCILLHLVNNSSSLAMRMLDAKLGGTLAELLLCLLCVGGVVPLVRFLSQKREQSEDALFENASSKTDSYEICDISPRRCVSLFFSFPMVLFFLLSIAQMIALIWMSVVYSYA